MLKTVMSIAGLLLIFPSFLGATTYYFSTAGDDANSGTSISSPKRSLAAANALAIGGNTILFRRGDAWYSPFRSFDLSDRNGSAENNISIGAYGSGPRPIIACLDPLDDTGWIRIDGTQTWLHKVSGYSRALRLFINGVSKYKVNTSDTNVNETSVNQPFEWFIKELIPGRSGVVLVNMDDGSAPANVEVLPAGAPSALTMHRTNYVIVQNIDFRGGSRDNIVYIHSPASHITIDSCIISRGNGSGILAENPADNELSSFVHDLTIINCVIDKVWSAHENDPKIRLSGDGIFLRHAVDRAILKRNTIRNWGHSGISITSYAPGVHGVHHIVVEENDVSAGNSGYMHAIDMNGFKDLTTHNIIRRNYFHDYLVTGHILGSFNFIYSNIFAGIKVSSMPLHSHQGWAVDWYPWRYRGNGPWMEAHDNYLINNTFFDAEEFLIMVNDHIDNPNPVRHNVIANNILCNFGQLAINVGNEVQGDILIENNAFWNAGLTDGPVRYKNKGGSENYSISQLNSRFPAYCIDNIQTDPRFKDAGNRNFRLTIHTPNQIRAGGTTKYNSLLGPEFTDYYGKSWDPHHPSMGAVQYQMNDL